MMQRWLRKFRKTRKNSDSDSPRNMKLPLSSGSQGDSSSQKNSKCAVTPIQIPQSTTQEQVIECSASLVCSLESSTPSPSDKVASKTQTHTFTFTFVGVSSDALDTMIPESNRVPDLHSLFHCQSTLGSGGHGRVENVVLKPALEQVIPRKEYALKVVSTHHDATNKKIMREVETLRALKEVNGVVQLVDVYCDRQHFGLLFEKGKPLFDVVMSSGRMSETHAKWIMFRLLQTVAALHAHRFAHRDIKLENVIICNAPLKRRDSDDKNDQEQLASDPDAFYEKRYGVPKLIDFGDALKVSDQKHLTEFVGTVCYLSPERLRRHRGWEARASDMFALGVTLYEMLTGKRCFYGNDDQHVLKKILKNRWHWPKKMKGKPVSPLGREFLQELLEPLAEKRMTAREALMHRWFDSL